MHNDTMKMPSLHACIVVNLTACAGLQWPRGRKALQSLAMQAQGKERKGAKRGE